MVTRNQEDYLKVIYDENLKGTKITNKFISDSLNIKAPSVSGMLNKLIDDGYLVKDNKFGFLLTDEGMKITELLLSKHRLWELFLIEHLGYTWDEVHKDADKLEHVTSDHLLKKLNIFLGMPKNCPHGKPIYINNKNVIDSFGDKLIDKSVNFKGYINVIEDDSDLLVYLTNKGIKINDDFEIIEMSNLDQSVILLINNEKITISMYAANRIYVV